MAKSRKRDKKIGIIEKDVRMNRRLDIYIEPYVLPFDRKSKDGVMARKVLKFQRVGGVIINHNNPEDFR